ncbi:hypothetical protein [Streptomyces sp. NPDC002520]
MVAVARQAVSERVAALHADLTRPPARTGARTRAPARAAPDETVRGVFRPGRA